MRGFRASSERDPDEFDKPVLKRFLGTDPFPWILALAVLLWVSLGLAARHEPVFGGILVLAGIAICFLAHLWLFLSILLDGDGGFSAVLSTWMWTFCTYRYAEVIWRPGLLTFVGVMMMFTGMGMGLNLGLRR